MSTDTDQKREIRLAAGDAELTIHPTNGCRLASLRVGGTELLRQGDRYGCFPMVPWAGRIGLGRFRNGGEIHQLPLNSPPHAIHGTGRDTSWRTARKGASEAAFTYELADPWPYTGRVTQLFELTGDSLTLTLGVETYDDSFPAQAGWHPWFLRHLDGSTADEDAVRLDFSPSGRRSAARTICPPAAVSSRAPARGTTASGCPTASRRR